jgi:hypothetical protein
VSGNVNNRATWTAASVIVPPMSTPLNVTASATATLTMAGGVGNDVYLPTIQR